MTNGSHERFHDAAGAYLLGALPDLERTAFERHVMGCSTCQDEVERLRPAAEALPRTVTPIDPPKALKRSLMSAIAEDAAPGAAGRTERREGWVARTRRRIGHLLPDLPPAAAWAAATFMLVVGAALGLGGSELLDRGPDERSVAATVDEERLAQGSGTLLVMEEDDRAILSVHGLPAKPDDDSNGVYQAWLVRGNEVIPSSVFSISSDGEGTTAIPHGVGEADAVWVTREAAGGSAAPSEPPVMRVDLN